MADEPTKSVMGEQVKSEGLFVDRGREMKILSWLPVNNFGNVNNKFRRKAIHFGRHGSVELLKVINTEMVPRIVWVAPPLQKKN